MYNMFIFFENGGLSKDFMIFILFIYMSTLNYQIVCFLDSLVSLNSLVFTKYLIVILLIILYIFF
jgi:hypothetical protein